MRSNSDKIETGSPRWRYLLLAVLVFVLAGAAMALLWQVPRLFPDLVEPTVPGSTPTAPRPPVTPTPSIRHPTFTHLAADVDDQTQTITFHMSADVPPDRQIEEVILWYDTESGHQLERTNGPLLNSVAITYKLDPAQEGLTTTLHSGQLDYWWLVRDTTGESVRAGSSLELGPSLQTLVVTPTLEPPYVNFTWTVSSTKHFQFHYVSGGAAERDRFELGALAEAALDHVTNILAVEFDGQMSIYFVPRVFWQGGAAYGNKVQLISYLDRNYTAIETWSYFTHEGTHALAQDLPLPKEDGGGPDGVLTEGLAVWASGGHYHQDPIDVWAAVTADSEDYVPLADLRAGPFYDFQHEISYIEAASFVKFLINRYGLEKFKELYSLATNDSHGDEVLVQRLYGQGYARLEAEWLAYLDELAPTPEQAETWFLEVRAFDLLRRYETELDPDARLLPTDPPSEWVSDTLKVFLTQAHEPVNIVLETALIATQHRLRSGDLDGATALLDDVEAALDAGGALERPSLQARQQILALLAAQDRAILLADKRAYLETLDPAYAAEVPIEDMLRPPFTAFEQEIVQLDIADDGLSAEGAIALHAKLADAPFPDDEQLYSVTFSKTADGWLMTSRRAAEVLLSLPAVMGD